MALDARHLAGFGDPNRQKFFGAKTVQFAYKKQRDFCLSKPPIEEVAKEIIRSTDTRSTLGFVSKGEEG